MSEPIAMRKVLDWFRNRRIAPAEPLPDKWTAFLRKRSAHYRRLPIRLHTTFEQDVQRFIASRRITGVETNVDDALRLLVAASAVTLSAGWRGYKWGEVTEVLLYADDFDRDYTIGRRQLAGVAHVWGTVILSVPSLRRSFAHDGDTYHVGFHEFAHLLTYERGLPITVPVGLSSARVRLWENTQARELKRIVAGDSILDPYALQPSEFFPCAVEAFFQRPVDLCQRHRTLYRFLCMYFRQRPALWESRLRARWRPA